ncbi:hypothetical protein BDZ89DRAFT_1166016 [Hymenopellis radicata]|nr:hypothetical protein BDZ89DRAFT_1166016 [Hymenopellis radicata]
MSCSPALECSSCTFIAHWLCALLFKIAVGVEDGDEVIEFVFSSHYQKIFESVYELVCSPYQTPFTLYQIIVFSLRFYSQTQLLVAADFGGQAAEEFVMTVRVFYLIALQATGDVEFRDMQQIELSGMSTLSEYKNIRQNLMNAVASSYTGTIQIGHTEWEDYLVDISRLSVLIPHGDADLDDMTAVIDVLFKYMQITSSKGSMPLSELSFPHHHSLPPLVFDESPSPVDTDLISLSPSFVMPDDLEPSSPRFFTAPSSPSEWNPAEDPIVDCGRRRTKNIAPGSGAAVYDLDSEDRASSSVSSLDSVQDAGILELYHPSPKRAVTLDFLKLEAAMQQEVEKSRSITDPLGLYFVY